MDCIPDDKSMVMKLTQNNLQKVKSPKIEHNISINTLNVYNYIYNSLLLKKYNEPYKILTQLKTIIRCVWRTFYTKSEYPDVKYLYSVSNYSKGTKKQPSYLCKTLTITPETKEIDSYALVILQRNLIPDFDYKIDTFTADLWDKYLLILDNILLSEAIEHRKILKEDRDRQLSSLPRDNKEFYDEQSKIIMNAYFDNIENLKQKYIFKIINFLNYLYYNNENRKLAWSAVLLRLSVVTKNKYHNEQYKHNQQDFINYIRSYNYKDKYELLQLYVAIIVYNYQFIHKSIIKYDKQYIETIIYYLTDHLPSYEDYIKSLYSDVMNNIQLLKLLVDENELITFIINNHLNKYSYKLKQIEEIIKTNFDKDIIEKYNITTIIANLVAEADITKLFNKLTKANYAKITTELNKYDKEYVKNVFLEKCFITYGTYTEFVVNYLLNIFDNHELNNLIIDKLNSINHNTSTASLIGLLMVKFDNTNYYYLSKDSITTLSEANKHSPTVKVKDFMLTVARELIKESTGFDKFQLSEIINN